MQATGKKDPVWVLLMFTLSFICVMYIYDRAFAYGSQESALYAEQLYRLPRACTEGLTEHDRNLCEDFKARARAKLGEGRNMAAGTGSGAGDNSCATSSI